MSGETSYRLQIKDKGRVVLPAALRTQCGFEIGGAVVARSAGAGRLILETEDVVLERIWSGNPEGGSGAVDDLREWQQSAGAQRWQRLESGDPDAGSTDRGLDSLESLGLA